MTHVVNALIEYLMYLYCFLRVLCIMTLLLNCFLIIADVVLTSQVIFYSQNSVE